MKNAKQSFPAEIAEYAKATGYSNKPAFRWWVDYVIKKKKNPCSTDEEDLFRQFLELKERCDKNEKQLKDLEEMADSLNKMLTARQTFPSNEVDI